MRYLLCILFAVQLHGATYYVATNGNDSADGSSGTPWLTITKAASTAATGDTVIINSGDYDEYVQESTAGVTYRAATPRASSLRAFRFSNTGIVLDGLKLTAYQGINNLWGAAVYVDSTAHNGTITNCAIQDSVYVRGHDFQFTTNNEVISAGSDFVTAGFKPGGKFYLGSSGMAGLYYTNHDTAWLVSAVDTNTLTLTNAAAESFAADAGSNYWAIVRPGTGSEGAYGISFVASGGKGATNFAVVGNTISNWVGSAINITSGDGIRVEGNTVSALHSFRFIAFSGNNHVIRSNTVRSSPNIIHYTQDELTALEHPEGTGWYDYQVGMIGSFTSTITENTNNLVAWNWFEGLENQMGRVDDEEAATYGITYAHNVFYGVSDHFSGGRDSMHWVSNTFYKCTYNGAHPLAIGGRAPAQTNYVIQRNLFIDCGSYEDPSDWGFYTISTNAIDPVADFNMVAGPEMLGFNSKVGFTESNGINGGDPLFVNAMDPDGPDNIPFTSDDGLRLLSSSPAAGAGALGTYAGTIAAHFRITSPSTWQEGLGTNYNSDWLTNTPTRRGTMQRPYLVPALVGSVPTNVVFSAADSLGTITNYVWWFGDASEFATLSTNGTTVSHTFTRPGDRIVTLTAYSADGVHTCSNVYRFTGTGTYYVATNGSDSADGSLFRPFATLNKAADVVSAGSTVVASPGRYAEKVDCTVDAAETNRIYWVGYGATAGGFNLRKSDYTIEGFTLDGTGVGSFGSFVYGYAVANRLHILNNTMQNATNVFGTYFVRGASADPTVSSSFCIISNNTYRNIGYVITSGFGQSNVITRNRIYDGNGQVDLFRWYGQGHIISENYATNICAEYENHADIYQVFGPQDPASTNEYQLVKDIILERNMIVGSRMQICQLETYDNPPEMMTNLVWRNNILNVNSAANCGMDGVKWYNNLFYRNTTNTGHVITGGGTKGTAYGSEIMNNLFYRCGYSDSSGFGWYSTSPMMSNGTLDADYNFVCGDDYAAKDAAPPDSFQRFGSYSLEANGINGGNPMFVNEAAYDFRLATNSPLLGAGVVIAGFSDTFDGSTRPVSWSIGPFESAGESQQAEPIPPEVNRGSARAQRVSVGVLRLR